MSADEREEIFRSSNHGLRETRQNQLAAHRIEPYALEYEDERNAVDE